MNSENPIFFFIDILGIIGNVLHSYSFWGVSLLVWMLGFLLFSMVVSIFWRGARG